MKTEESKLEAQQGQLDIPDVMVNEVEFCVYCKTKPKSWGSDYCGECIDNGNYIKQN